MFPSPMNKQNWIFCVLPLFFLGFPVFSVSAFKEGSSPISLETSNGDRYEVGQSPIASLETEGDLVLAGHTVSVSKNVQEDLAAFGQNVSVSANIGGDARIVGQFVTVSGSVGGHLAIAGQTITIDEGGDSGKIEGDLLIAGQQVWLYTPVQGNVFITAEEVFIANTIAGDVHISSPNVTFGEQGKIMGSVTLTAWENTIPKEKVAGDIIFHEQNFHSQRNSMHVFSERFLGMRLFSFLISLLVGLLICWKMPRFGISYGMFGKEKPFISLGIGFLVLFLTPLASLLLLPLFPLFFLVMFSYASLLIFACLTSAFLLGSALIPLQKNPSFGKCFGSYAAGAGTLFVIGALPYFGALFSFLVFCAALGSLVQVKKDMFVALRKAKKI